MRADCKDIKNIFVAAVAAILCALGLFGCAKPFAPRLVRVSITDSIFFTVDTPAAEVERGADFSTIIRMRDGYEFVSCDYGDYSVEKIEDVGVELTLENVVRPSRVTVVSKKTATDQRPVIDIKCSINYDYNGGYCGDGAGGRTVDYALTAHLRPNTWNGAGLVRRGYTLYGWNTAADGSGEHIGLGSRATVANGESATLYAEWLEQIDENLFLYRPVADGACAVTGYRGDGKTDPFVIPSELGGMAVVEIASSFTINIPCGELTAKRLVVPNTVKVIRSNAFVNSNFSEICFSDNIEEIAENAFPYNFETYRINAFLPPCFQDKNNSTLFADNMDRLIVNKDKRKMIFFSGCSFAYGLDSRAVDKAFGGEYVVMNMGMNGDINGAFQMDILQNYITDGDVFVHAPEEMSPSQLMFGFFTNNIMFIMAEGNYDLLAHADFSKNGGVLRAFLEYIELKNSTAPCDYGDGIYHNFNIYGDYTEDRPYDEATEAERDTTYSDNVYCYEPSFLTDASVGKLAEYYETIEARGGRVFLSYAPVNTSARALGEIERKGEEFANKFESMLAPHGFNVISDVKDYMFPGRYFFDSDYHLNDLGALLRTERLVRDLKNAGVK